MVFPCSRVIRLRRTADDFGSRLPVSSCSGTRTAARACRQRSSAAGVPGVRTGAPTTEALDSTRLETRPTGRDPEIPQHCRRPRAGGSPGEPKTPRQRSTQRKSSKDLRRRSPPAKPRRKLSDGRPFTRKLRVNGGVTGHAIKPEVRLGRTRRHDKMKNWSGMVVQLRRSSAAAAFATIGTTLRRPTRISVNWPGRASPATRLPSSCSDTRRSRGAPVRTVERCYLLPWTHLPGEMDAESEEDRLSRVVVRSRGKRSWFMPRSVPVHPGRFGLSTPLCGSVLAVSRNTAADAVESWITTTPRRLVQDEGPDHAYGQPTTRRVAPGGPGARVQRDERSAWGPIGRPGVS